jgi:glycerol-3-phosphate dehydrogenase (NAD(P)+)
MALSVAVIGAGAWGLALAAAAARASGSAMLYSRKPLGTPPAGVTLVGDMKDVGAGARIVVLAVPSGVAREVARQLGDHIDGRHFVVHGIRGLSGPNLDPVSEVVRQETPARRVGALGGPALAEDLLAGKPSVLVCGSAFPEVSSAVAEAFGSRALRVYTTTDLRGLEWASALVGCLAIGIGLAQEAGVSPGLVAAVISRGVEEAARIAEAAGGEERTLLGLAGYGDLLASIAQQERPEVRLGRALGRGMPLSEAVGAAKLRVEAVELIPRLVEWTKSNGVDAPILAALSRTVLAGRPVGEIIDQLMTNPMRKG